MSKILRNLFLTVLFLSCVSTLTQAQNDAVVVGLVDSATSRAVRIEYKRNHFMLEDGNFETVLDGNNVFSFRVKITESRAINFTHRNETVRLFLTPGDTLKIHFRSKHMLETMVFEGNGAIHNDYLIKSDINLSEADRDRRATASTETSSAKAHLTLVDNLYNAKKRFFDAYPTGLKANFSNEFLDFVLNDNTYWRAFHLMEYVRKNGLNNSDLEKQVDDTYFNFLFETDNAYHKALNNQNYIKYLDLYLGYIREKSGRGKQTDGDTMEIRTRFVQKVRSKGQNIRVLEEPYLKNDVVSWLSSSEEADYQNLSTIEKFKYVNGDTLKEDFFVKIKTREGKLGWVPQDMVENFDKTILDTVYLRRFCYQPEKEFCGFEDNLTGKVLYFTMIKDILLGFMYEPEALMRQRMNDFISRNTSYDEYNTVLKTALQHTLMDRSRGERNKVAIPPSCELERYERDRAYYATELSVLPLVNRVVNDNTTSNLSPSSLAFTPKKEDKTEDKTTIKGQSEADAKAKADEAAKMKLEADAKAKADEAAEIKADADAKAKLADELRLKLEADAKAKLAEENKVKAATEARLKAEADARAVKLAEEERLTAETKVKLEVQIKADADARAIRLAQEERLKAEAKAKADAQAKAEAEAKAAKIVEETRLKAGAKAKADAQAKADAEAKAAKLAEQTRLKAEAKAKADAQAKADAEAKAAKLVEETRLKAEAKAKGEAEIKAVKLAAEARLKAEAEARATQLAEEARLKEQAKAAKLAEEVRLKAEAEARAAKLAEENRLKAEAKAKAEAEQIRLKAGLKAKAEADAKAEKLAEEARLKAEVEAKAAKLAEQARLKAEAQAKVEEAEAKAAKLATEARLKAEAEAKAARLAEEARLIAEVKLKAETKAKAEAEARAARLAEEARLAAEAKAKAEAQAKAETEAKAAKLAEEVRIKAENDANAAKLAEEARIKADQIKVDKLAEETRLKEEEEKKVKLAEAKAKLDEETRIKLEKAKAALDEETRITLARTKAELDGKPSASTQTQSENNNASTAQTKTELEGNKPQTPEPKLRSIDSLISSGKPIFEQNKVGKADGVADLNVIMNDPNDTKPKNPNERIVGNLRYVKQPDGTFKVFEMEPSANNAPVVTTPPTNSTDIANATTDPNKPRVRFIAPKGVDLDTTQEIMPILENLEFDPTGQFVEFKGLVLNEDMPRFTLVDINGRTVTQEDMKNKVIFIDFWASWCGPCVAQFSHAKKLMEKYKNDDVLFLYISIDSDIDSWKEFLKDSPMAGVHANDKLILPINFQVTGIPNAFIIGRNGKIAFNSRLKSKINDERMIQVLLKNN